MIRNILLVDDSPELLRALTRQLRAERLNIISATSGEQALSICKQKPIQVAVIDEQMPRMRGSHLAEELKKLDQNIVNIMLTGNPSMALLRKVLNAQSVFRFLTKPYHFNELRAALEAALEQHAISQICTKVVTSQQQRSEELRRLEQRYPGISQLDRAPDGAVVVGDGGTKDIDSLIQLLEICTHTLPKEVK